MSDKNTMSANRLAAVNEECARLNARSVVQRMALMQEIIDGYREELNQTNQRLALLEQRFTVEQQLRAAMQNGSGPTV
jgi:hypothetical protein